MTCIVAIAHPAGVTMGVDSASSDGHRMYVAKTSKLVRLAVPRGEELEHAVLGFTTSWRMGQLLRSLRLPDWTGDAEEWAVERFIPELRSALKDGGFATQENGAEQGGQFLLGLDRRLFMVQQDYAVLENEEPIAAVGSGMDFALAALAAVQDREIVPEDMLRAALEIAERYVTTVRGPFSFMSTHPERP